MYRVLRKSIFICLLVLSFVSTASAASDQEKCQSMKWMIDEAGVILRSDPASAAKIYDQALDICSGNTNMRYNLALAQYAMGKTSESVASLASNLQVDTDHRESAKFLAYIYVADNIDVERGKALAQSLLDKSPKDKDLKKIIMMALTGSPATFKSSATSTVKTPRRSSRKSITPSNTITAPITGKKNPDGIAVIIGNRDYDNKDIPSVDYALNDALSVKEHLINTLGFKPGNIIYMENASKGRFESVFGTPSNHRGKLYNYLKKGKSSIFVYYSGHGAPELRTKDGYFVPSDADPQTIGLSGYSLNVLYKNIAMTAKEMRSPKVLIVIEACFSGASEKGLLIKNASPITISVKNPLIEIPNAAVLTSSSGAEVSSWYPEKGHSLFTYFFLKALRDSAGNIDTVKVKDIHSILSDKSEGVPYFARRLHGRIQSPQAMGSTELGIR